MILDGFLELKALERKIEFKQALAVSEAEFPLYISVCLIDSDNIY